MVGDGIRHTFALQAEACEALGSGFTASLCRRFGAHLSLDTAVGKLVLEWSGDPSPSADSIPLRLCGGLHALVLSGRDAALAQLYPPHRDTAPDWPVIEAALAAHEAFLLDWMTSPPQTNEVGRSGIVWPAMMMIAQETGKPLRLLEVGASGGLNLQMDRFAYRFGGAEAGIPGSKVRIAPEMRGEAVSVVETDIADRTGCDINPLDPTDDADALRLRAYVWPDQADRLARLDGALALARQHPIEIESIDAIQWLERELEAPRSSVCTVIYSTIAWQYLPEAARAQGAELIDEAGRRTSEDAPLVWLRFEADGQSPGAGITVQMWPDGSVRQLGRADFHGRWLDWGAATKAS